MAADEAGNRPIGLLILGRKRPGFDQEWSQLICRRGVAALQALGYVVIGADEHAPDDAAVKAALGKIVAARCEALVILQPSIGNGQLALTVAQRWQASLILWATPERPGGGKVSSCSLVGQHLWASTLRQAGHPFEFVYGDPDDARVRAELSRAIALARTTAALNMAKVGIVGTHAPGFIDMAADPFLLRKSIGIQLHSLSLPQFIERAQSVPDETAHADVQRVRDLKLPSNGIGEEALAVNSRCYIALSALMEEESLDALALQCWPELPNVLGQWP
jgi:L-fucose isomerase-like protein